jgi:hypothetical protein
MLAVGELHLHTGCALNLLCIILCRGCKVFKLFNLLNPRTPQRHAASAFKVRMASLLFNFMYCTTLECAELQPAFCAAAAAAATAAAAAAGAAISLHHVHRAQGPAPPLAAPPLLLAGETCSKTLLRNFALFIKQLAVGMASTNSINGGTIVQHYLQEYAMRIAQNPTA